MSRRHPLASLKLPSPGDRFFCHYSLRLIEKFGGQDRD